MNSEWKEYKLGDLCSIRRGSSPRPIKEYFSDSGMPWVKISDATESNSRYISKTNQYIKELGVKNSVIVKKGDLILSNSGTAALPKFMDITACIHDGWQVFDDLKNIDIFFLYYSLIFYRGRLLHGAYDSTMQNLTLDMVRELAIYLPPLPEQKRIAEILSSLDEKIELNNRMNKTLEEMAQAIFKQWFVDFEFPDENGNPYKSTGGEMIQSELGDIPEGWSVKELGACYDLVMGQSPPGTSYNEEGDGIVFYQGRTDFGFRFPTNRLFTTSPTRYAKKLDTLVSVRAPVGDINMANEDCCIGRGLSSIRHKTGSYSFTFYSMKNIANDFLKFESEGTVFGSINKNSFEKIKMIEPTKKIIKSFDRLNGLDDMVLKNTIEIQTLTKTRDSLLSKLMSGEIRV